LVFEAGEVKGKWNEGSRSGAVRYERFWRETVAELE
jgi:hypothetical protein